MVTSRATAHADREPTAAEEKLAERNEIDPDVADHHKEMTERGANQQARDTYPDVAIVGDVRVTLT